MRKGNVNGLYGEGPAFFALHTTLLFGTPFTHDFEYGETTVCNYKAFSAVLLRLNGAPFRGV